MDTATIIVIILSILGIIYIEAMIGAAIGIWYAVRNRANPFDIIVIELKRNAYVVRIEKGRRILDPLRGWKMVTTTRFGIKGMKDNLGYEITDNFFLPTKGHRQLVFVTLKDGVPAGLEIRAVKKFLESLPQHTDDDKKQYEITKATLQMLINKRVLPISLFEIPDNLSITPVKTEALRLKADIMKDAQAAYNKKGENWGKIMAIAGMAIFALCVVGIIVLLALMISQGPEFASKVASRSAATQEVNDGTTGGTTTNPLGAVTAAATGNVPQQTLPPG